MHASRIRPQKSSKTFETEYAGAFALHHANFGALLRRAPPENRSAGHKSRKNLYGPQRPVPKRESTPVNARIHGKHEDQVAPLPVASVYGPAFFRGASVHIGPIEEPTVRGSGHRGRTETSLDLGLVKGVLDELVVRPYADSPPPIALSPGLTLCISDVFGIAEVV